MSSLHTVVILMAISTTAALSVFGQGPGPQEKSSEKEEAPSFLDPKPSPPPGRSFSSSEKEEGSPVPNPLSTPGRKGPQYVQSGNIIIAWSSDMSTAWGFSKSTGTWTKLALKPKATEEPIVGQNVAAIRCGTVICAYSAARGDWDVLDVKPQQNANVAVHRDFILVTIGNTVYTFADSNGRWMSMEGQVVGRQPQAASAQTPRALRVYPLGQLDGETVKQTIMTLLPDANIEVDVAADGKTLVVRATPQAFKVVDNLFGIPENTTAWIPRQPQPNSNRANFEKELVRLTAELNSKQSQYGPKHPVVMNLEIRIRALREAIASATVATDSAAAPASIHRLEENYQRLERAAQQTARRLRQLQQSKRNEEHDLVQKSDLMKQLKDEVQAAFEARQVLQRAQMQQLSSRVERIRSTLQMRETIAEEIVKRRIEQLLNPNLKWDIEATRAAPNPGAEDATIYTSF